MEVNSEDVMQSESFLKCSCNHCGGHIEFPPAGIGQSISCPHCGEQTELIQNVEGAETPVPNEKEIPAAKQKRPFVLIIFIALALLCAMSAGIFFAIRQSASSEKEETVKIPPEDVSSVPAKRHKKFPKASKENAANPVAVSASKDWNGLKSSDVTVEKSGGRLIYAVGTIRNETDRQRFGVTVDLDLFDAQGKKIGSATDYTQVIEPKNQWSFRALVTDPNTVRAEITGVKEN
jgi:hypothetical protein